MKIVFVGAGRLATHFAQALHQKGHDIVAVYSRTLASASVLASKVGAQPTDAVDALPLQADAFIISVKDDALAAVAAQLAVGREDCLVFHTAGSVPMSVLSQFRQHGVIYPMQTFSKERELDFSRIPIFIEANSQQAQQQAEALASSVSNDVRPLDGDARRYLHLAAVFACNFANHCYALAADILEKLGLPFSVMLPLIEETAQKVATMHPLDAQTGPAVRYDENVIRAQQQLLADEPLMQEIYTLMSQSIHHFHNKQQKA